MIELKPDEQVIQTLERLLEEAKAGEIISIAYTCLHPAYLTSSGWSGMKYPKQMLGEITLLQRDIQDLQRLTVINPVTGEENY